jgi:hypothetical protein
MVGLRPTKVPNGKATVDALTGVCHRFGYYSDCGADFHSRKYTEWAEKRGIESLERPDKRKNKAEVDKLSELCRFVDWRMTIHSPGPISSPKHGVVLAGGSRTET